MTGSCTLNLNRNPNNNKLQSGYSATGTLTIPNNGSGEPTIEVFDNWMTKTVGARAPKGKWDSALYGGTAATAYPKYYAIDNVVGIGSRNTNDLLTYTITVQNSTVYKITITGSTSFIMTSSGAATASEIVSNLVAQINADSGCKATASGTTTLILARKNAAIPFAVYNPVSYPTAGYDTAGDSAGSGVNMISDLGALAGFTKSLASNPKDVFTAFQIGTPAGYFFSGASTENTGNPSSNVKCVWFSEQPLDDTGRSDFVSLSRPDAGEWSPRGNQSNVVFNAGNQIDFGKLNSFMTMHKAGATPFIDNGTARTVSAGLAGSTTNAQTDRPLFVRRTTFTINVLNVTLYTVTINGTACTYISDTSATLPEIVAGLVADINSKISNTVGIASSQAGKLTFDPVTGGLPTISTGANITSYDLLPYFTEVVTIWHGNDNQVNTLHVYPWIYIASGVYCGNYVALGNASTWSAVTDWKALPHSTWDSANSQHNTTPEQVAGKTHWYRFVDNIPIMSGSL